MTYVVTESCIGVKDHACVDVCPVECFYEGEDQILIHPDECIDCAACVPVCPVEAIFAESDVPDQWKDYIAKNADAFRGDQKPPVALVREKWETEKGVEGSVASLYYKKYPKA